MYKNECVCTWMNKIVSNSNALKRDWRFSRDILCIYIHILRWNTHHMLALANKFIASWTQENVDRQWNRTNTKQFNRMPTQMQTNNIDRDTQIHTHTHTMFSHGEIWDDIKISHKHTNTHDSTSARIQLHVASNWAQALDKSIFKMTDNFDHPHCCLCVSDSGINFTAWMMTVQRFCIFVNGHIERSIRNEIHIKTEPNRTEAKRSDERISQHFDEWIPRKKMAI